MVTGETGECPSLEPSGIGTRGSCFSRRMLCGEDGSEETGFRYIGLVVAGPLCGGEESTAAIAKGKSVSSRIASAFDQVPVLQRFQVVLEEKLPLEEVRLAQCYCDDCEFTSSGIGAFPVFLY